MVGTYLTLFLSFAACQALLVVKLADWLSPGETTDHGAPTGFAIEGIAARA